MQVVTMLDHEERSISRRGPSPIRWPTNSKNSDTQPDYRVVTQGVEIGAGRVRRSDSLGNDTVSLSPAPPAFGLRSIYAIVRMRCWVGRFGSVRPRLARPTE
jgi:hypothetical protein